MGRSPRITRGLAAAIAVGALLGGGASAEEPPGAWVQTPMSCTRGGDSRYLAFVTAPSTVKPGERFTVRLASANSGKLDNRGLHYIHDMTTELGIVGGEAVEARAVPESGSANARAGAAARLEGQKVRFVIPAHIEKGSDYTPPTLELTLRAPETPGAIISIHFQRYEVSANAFLVGDVQSSCLPKPGPFTVVRIQVGGGRAG